MQKTKKNAASLNRIKKKLSCLYSKKKAEEIFPRLINILEEYKSSQIILAKKKLYKNKISLTNRDSILITYGDSITRAGEKPLKTLHDFLKNYVKRAVSGVHILPFFPYSSDDGFSVIDYKKVNSKLGDWKDIQKIGKDYRLMADLVLNHVSVKSNWFKGFLDGDEKYEDYFIHFDKKIDTSKVFRPRVNPLLTKFETKKGDKFVWTTFSEDQVDLNYRNPEVLLEIISVMLFYLSQGVEILRMDAVAYLWKELGTSCIHLKKTHLIVKLFHNILKIVAPYAMILTETNVPYKKNISYFGKNDEANLIYQFVLPPVVIDAFSRGDATHLENFHKMIEKLSPRKVFFNFLASHDGVGVLGAKDFLTKKEHQNLFTTIKKHQGLISYKSLFDGSQIPYELNISYLDAINDSRAKNHKDIKKFIASQAVILSAKGIPGIYIHSLLGSHNDTKSAGRSGINRRINRGKINLEELKKELQNGNSAKHKIFQSYLKLLKARKKNHQFNPFRKEKIVVSDKRLLITERPNGLTTIINVSGQEIRIKKYLRKSDFFSKKNFKGRVLPYGVYFLV